MDRFEAMSLLITAVESGSLSKASRALGLPLATVSRKIAELETHLNASLLIRSAKGLQLTPAGRSYVSAARTILEQVTEAERAATGEYTMPKGELAVTAPILFGRLHVLPLITSFLSEYPEVSVGLVLTDRIADFLDDDVDVALRIGALPDSDLVATKVGAVRRVVCASPAYLAAHGTPVTLEDLDRHRAISFASVSSPSSWTFHSSGEKRDVPLRSRLSVNTIDAAIDAGLAGVGLVRAVSYQVIEHVRRDRLRIVLQPFEPPPSPVHLVYDEQSRLPLKVRAFVDFAVPRLRERVTRAALAGARGRS